MSDVFISFSSKDERRVAKMYAHLRERGFDVWWMKNIPPGASTIRTVSDQLESAKKIILAWSRHAAESPYVEGEVMHAFGARKLLPVRIEKWAWPAFLASVQFIDLTDDEPEAWRKIEERLRAADPAESARVPYIVAPRSAGPVGLLIGAAIVLAAALAGLSLLAYRAIETGDVDALTAAQYALLALPVLAAAPVLIAGHRVWLAWRSRPRSGGSP